MITLVLCGAVVVVWVSQAGTMYCLTLRAEGVWAGKGWERHCTLCG